MVAPSRPSLRSSTRRSAGLAESPATAIHQNTSITTSISRLKRARRSSSLDHEPQSIKKQKVRFGIATRSTQPARPRDATKAPEDSVTRLTVASHVVNGDSPASTAKAIDQSSQHVTLHPTSSPISDTPATASAQQADKRALRSHDGGSRLRSELALYFPNYEEIMSDEPRKAGI